MNKISAVIIAINEENQIGECLESVSWCNEKVIVVDDRTTDQTAQVARQFTDKVYVNKLLDIASQKNYALEKASNEWILSIDADERVAPSLAEELQRVLEKPQCGGYYIPFHTYIGSRRLRFGGMQNEWHLRLFKKAAGRFGGEFGGVVHERVKVKNTGYLHHPIIHYTYKDREDLLERVKEYSALEAQEFFKSGSTLTLYDELKPFLRFLNIYFRKLGFLDGWLGFVNALYLSYYVWWRNQLIKKGPESLGKVTIGEKDLK